MTGKESRAIVARFEKFRAVKKENVYVLMYIYPAQEEPKGMQFKAKDDRHAIETAEILIGKTFRQRIVHEDDERMVEIKPYQKKKKTSPF